jgi:F0F1-type ATP synthase assembly protein I
MTRSDRLQLIGWLLFVVCAVFYIVSSLESGSISSLIGSVLFLIACFLFMIPLFWKD